MKPALISADWGTTSLRVYLAAADGAVLARKESANGILNVSAGKFSEALGDATSEWRQAHGPLATLLSGMIGSRQGWIEAPYAWCPVRPEALARQCIQVPGGDGASPRIVPGAATRGIGGRPDVMRGEETQVLGALALLGIESGLFLLPGTHSKWVSVEGGEITGFRSYMTGEVFSALKGHTILGRLMRDGAATGSGFERGVRAGSEAGPPGALLNRIFSSRTLALLDELPAVEVSDYLSGLLIGAEMAAEATVADCSVTVIASPELARRYLEAAKLLGIVAAPAPADCVVAGHVALARAIGVIGA